MTRKVFLIHINPLKVKLKIRKRFLDDKSIISLSHYFLFERLTSLEACLGYEIPSTWAKTEDTALVQ